MLVKSSMKVLYRLLSIITLLSLSVEAQIPQPPDRPLVRLIYLVPTDQDIDQGSFPIIGQGWKERIRNLAVKTQRLYKKEMKGHGFVDANGEGKTFLLEKDEGDIFVHKIDGQYTVQEYRDSPDLNNMAQELFFDRNAPFRGKKEHIYLIFVETDKNYLETTGHVCGLGIALHHQSGAPPYTFNYPTGLFGIAKVPLNKTCIRDDRVFDNYDTAIQHELGHAFGLRHDYRNDEYIMSYGSVLADTWKDFGTKLSKCAAEWLNHHRAFNDVQRDLNSNTTFVSNAQNPREIVVADPDGVGSVQLIIHDPPGKAGDVSLVDCHSSNNRITLNTAETFDPTSFSATINGQNININMYSNITLQAIDKHGNITRLDTALYKLLALKAVVLYPKGGLTEATLAGGTVSLELTGPTYTTHHPQIKSAVTVEGIKGVTINPVRLQRRSDRKIEVTLAFDGTDFDANATLTFRVDAGAITNYNGGVLTAKLPVTAHYEDLGAAAASPLTEENLNGGVVRLTLADAAYEADISKIRNAVSVSGIEGVRVNTSKIQRHSDRTITVALNFDGTGFYRDTSLTFRVDAGAIAHYNGNVLTAKVFVTKNKEISAAPVSPLTEENLNGSVVLLRLTGAVYDPEIKNIRKAVSVFGIEGVRVNTSTIRDHNTKTISVALNFDGTDFDTDATLTFRVDAGAIANYNGGGLTAKLPVLARREESLLKIFWTNAGEHSIKRANLDGSNTEDLVTSAQGLKYPNDIALDFAGGKMYWTTISVRKLGEDIRYQHIGEHKIQRANLNGSNIEDLITHGLDVPLGIALDVEYGKMYWTNAGERKIQRANLDGSNIEDLVTSTSVPGLIRPAGIALDIASGKMYWTDLGEHKIQRANLDGSNTEDLVTRTQGVWQPSDIALDVEGGKMYWTNWVHIQRANLDGSNTEDLVTHASLQGLPRLWGIALDIAGGKMYWTDLYANKIQRANLDGSNIEDLVTHGLILPTNIAILSPAQPPVHPVRVKEDVNSDGRVDVDDLVYVAQQYGQTGTNSADVNRDGVVNVDDFILVAAVVDAGAAAAPAARAHVQSHFTASQLDQWLTEARVSGNTSDTYQRGIAVVEQLLALTVPEETALLANYPNPFNPETWIPYQLSEPTDVTLTIYDIQGHVVRDLDLGHQRAGMYQTRNRAAYWDGRNAQSESVASGVYFYTLTAGEFTATRKLLIRK
ncbi:MAG: T9SS type A sorting domain-containing protein [Candidatus Poribacteria bacterium]|nr:T9SS type A sorting domain-containing protein [Candidatus Poribacteria bacterium]